MTMTRENKRIAGWTRRYEAALRKYLKGAPGGASDPGQSLGRQAVILGLETLDLARAHEKALSSLLAPRTTARVRASNIKRAGKFFAAAAVRIENTHRAAIETRAHIRKLNRSLDRQKCESASSTRRLKKTIRLRKASEVALENSGKHYVKVLAESNRLLKNLRSLTRACLLAQENDRKETSRQLQDEIGQGLIGIHVQLLALKNALETSIEKVSHRAGTTQQLVLKSARQVNRSKHVRGDEH